MNSNNFKAFLTDVAQAIIDDNRELAREQLNSIASEANESAEAWLMQAWTCDTLQESEAAICQALDIDPDHEIASIGLSWIHGIQALADSQIEAAARLAELERQAEFERQAEIKLLEEEARHQAELERQSELERQGELERQAELARQEEIKRQQAEEEQRHAEESAQQAELDRQATLERAAEEQQKTELQLELKRRQAELKRQVELQRQSEQEEQAQQQRLAELEKQAEAERVAEEERHAEFERHAEQELLAQQENESTSGTDTQPAIDLQDAIAWECPADDDIESELKASIDEINEAVQQETGSMSQPVLETPVSIQADEPRQSSGKNPVILAVDDSPTVRKLVSLTLSAEGFEVITAEDGIDALNILSNQLPDLILCDITMPRLGGYRLCKFVKKHEHTRAIPVVMLSGKDGVFDKMRGKMNGCDDFVCKPFESAELVSKVREHLAAVGSGQ